MVQLLKMALSLDIIEESEVPTFRNLIYKGYGTTRNGPPIIKGNVFPVPLIIFVNNAWSIQADESMIGYFELLVERPERVQIVRSYFFGDGRDLPQPAKKGRWEAPKVYEASSTYPTSLLPTI